MTPARFARGFTMIEMLMTLAIAAILMTLAIPSFRNFLLNSRMVAQTNEFVLALASAKSEAVKRGVRVSVCSRASNTACAASTTWDGGWLVFVDNNGDGTVNGADVVLQVRAPLEGGNTLRAGAYQFVTFQSTGFLPAGTASDTLRLCDSRGMNANDPRSITITMQGRVTTARGTTACP
jgi:type IV fimbrial biogenesis protein FimT